MIPKIQNFPMESTLWAALPAYNRKKSRKPIANSDSQLKMNDAAKAIARGRWWSRVGMVNVGSMVKRSGEVSDMLCIRKVDVCGLQEVRFKNEGVRFKNEGVKFSQGRQKMRYKMFWKGGKEGQNGVGIAVEEEWVGSVVRVMRASERLMVVELILEG